MGAWGLGPFDNDEAADFVAELLEVDDPDEARGLLRDAFRDVTESTEAIESYAVSVGIAAAAVVGALAGAERSADAPEFGKWGPGGVIASDAGLRVEALGVLDRALLPEENEWFALWDESGELEAVRAALDPTRAALS